MSSNGRKLLDFSYFGKDAGASVVVFLVALPLCMGVAIASGVPPAAGLITSIVGGLLVGFIGGAPLQVSGPAAGLTVLVWQLVQEYGVGALGVVVLFGGVLQLLAGIFRLGQWFRAISPSVIHGMLAGIGVLILASQFHIMVDDAPRSTGLANLLAIPEAIYKAVFPFDGSVHHQAAAVGLVTIAVLVVWTKFRPASMKMLPAPLLGVLAGALTAGLFGFPVAYVEVPASLVESFNWVKPTDVSYLSNTGLLVDAFALAFIASAETLLATSAIDLMHRGPRANYDRELAAQGIGNILCGLVGALPMTGVIVRSSANVNSGARTNLSTMLHGAWILALIVVFPGVLRLIPTAALAAVLVYTGYKLVNPHEIRQLAKFGRSEVLIYAATLTGIVSFDLLKGVIMGFTLALAKLLYTFTHMVVRAEQSDGGRRVDLYIEGSATFIALPKLAKALDSVPGATELHVHFEKLSYIDHACLELIHNWRQQHEETGNSVVMEWEELADRYRRPMTSALDAAVSVTPPVRVGARV